MRGVTFQEAIEIIESLSEEQRESLIEIVKKHLIEERRDALAKSIKEAKKEYAHGEVRQGTVDELLREISK